MISSASPPIEEAGLTPTDGRCGAFDRRAGTGSSERNVSDIHCCGDIEAGHRGRRDRMEKCVGLGLGFLWVWVAWLAIREIRDILRKP